MDAEELIHAAGSHFSGAAMKSKPPPMTLGNAAAARVRLIVWCRACGHRVEPDAGELARRHGPETTVPDWRERLVCSRCGSRNVDMVVTGTERR
jgi:rubredoxin